ncbi:hypothetical protein DFJ58DRAFT_744336 [Suillus subalutaceus]|uniref:uncharacterized protein n=1 Tax=Suillus subalutaceus TaxID=48586 RepID=UPI001B8724B0|nr:uncharacterized protein DFJ58DRAFT_744336 [Suillus subalutaceus]KAG1861197.1 hypothetical protein DFJ58DRAFT_744336 [Suillus subalutaceus]
MSRLRTPLFYHRNIPQLAASPTSTSLPTSVPSALSSSSDTTAGNAFLMSKLTAAKRTQIYWIATALASEGLWTIRFSLECQEHLWWTGIALALIASLGCMVLSFLAGNNSDSLGIILLASASSLAVFRYAWPAWRNRHYCSNRWAAWTGPSRTGIDAALVPLVKGDDPWPIFSKGVQVMKQHPVDIRLFRSRLIADDPTDILKAKRRIIDPGMSGLQPVEEEEKSLKIVERGPDNRTGLYEPVRQKQSASLLWGAYIGFSPRVSRAILAVPSRLLKSSPLTDSGHDGQSVCLAHGILGRNKGLAPKIFILGLDIKILEEKSVQWPRPSKVLRSYFKDEMEAAYGSLPKNYINAATELALLLADSSHALVADWLVACMEHQDIALNNQVARLGASDADLQLLYQLSYAAMLVSLSAHRKGRKYRPEMKLFVAYWTRYRGGVDSLPDWTTSGKMTERVSQEESDLGVTDLNALIDAVCSGLDIEASSSAENTATPVTK